MTLRSLIAPVLVSLSLGLAACGGDSDETTGGAPAETSAEPTQSEPAPSGEAARSEKVEIVEFAYQPDPVTIASGGKVIWLNEDVAPHTATADDGSFDTGTLEKGKLKSESFDRAGTYPYFCEIHPDMRGAVEVVE